MNILNKIYKNKLIFFLILFLLILVIIFIINTAKLQNNSGIILDEENENIQNGNLRDNDGKNIGGSIENSKSKSSNKNNNDESSSSDEELEKLIKEVEPKFSQLEFNCSNGSINYNLFVPNDYDTAKTYPLVLVLSDINSVGESTKSVLEQGYGGIIWAESSNQNKNECFVLVPSYKKEIIDSDYNATNDINITMELVNSIIDKYNINLNRLYITGQGMGGRAAVYILNNYYSLFAGAIIVSCEWNSSNMNSLKNNNIFYIVAEDDNKSVFSQNNLIAFLNNQNIPFESDTWDATWDKNKLETKINELSSSVNIIKMKKDTLLEYDVSQTIESVSICDYVYKISSLREWLFSQTK